MVDVWRGSKYASVSNDLKHFATSTGKYTNTIFDTSQASRTFSKIFQTTANDLVLVLKYNYRYKMEILVRENVNVEVIKDVVRTLTSFHFSFF